MLLPFAKLFSLCLRLFTRPTINFAKATLKQKSDHPPFVQEFLISTGHLYHDLYTKLQRSFLPVASRAPIKPLSEEKALEAGVEFTCEVVVYGVLFGWGIYELRKVTVESKKKEVKQQDLLAQLVAEAQEMETMQSAIEARVRELTDALRLLREEEGGEAGQPQAKE